MRKSKLGLDFDKVDKAKGFAKQIADGVQQFVNKHTTVAVERTLCRLLGIDGVDVHDVPLPNVVVNQIQERQDCFLKEWFIISVMRYWKPG